MELASAELRFETSSDGVPRDVLTKGEVPMMRVIAELMIAANAAAAEKIVWTQGVGRAFVRRHPPPRPEGFDELRGLMRRAGVSLDASDGAALANSLVSAISKATSDKVSDNVSDVHGHRRSSSFGACRGGSDRRAVPRDGDAGDVRRGTRRRVERRYLALRCGALATHFTSPIRRYADVVVHGRSWTR